MGKTKIRDVIDYHLPLKTTEFIIEFRYINYWNSLDFTLKLILSIYFNLKLTENSSIFPSTCLTPSLDSPLFSYLTTLKKNIKNYYSFSSKMNLTLLFLNFRQTLFETRCIFAVFKFISEFKV